MNDLCDIELWPFDLEMVHGTLSPPWFYMYMGCVYQEPRSGHGKNFKWPLWPWTLTRFFTQKWCATHRHLMGCVCTTYEVNRSDKDGATERTRPKLRTTPVTFIWNDRCDLNLWPFELKMDRDTLSCHAKYTPDWSNSHGAMERTRQNLRMAPVTLTFDLVTSNCTCHKHFIGSMSGVSFMKIQW